MASATETPLDLVIRFSTSNPDIVLRVEKASTTTCLSLKQQIRAHLDAPASESRLRLIHAGKVLPDHGALSASLHVILPPPTSSSAAASYGDTAYKSEKARGKQPVRDSGAPHPAAARRVYIHCSIGDVLTPSELSAEARAASAADAALVSKTHPSTLSPTTTNDNAANAAASNTMTTTPAPRGFDRLLTAGFTPTEITALRTQFRAIQSHTHTPDTMPSGPELLALEERWLDSTTAPPSAGGGAEDTGGFGAEDAGGLEDMLWGNLMGFFWPVGAMFWMMREEGVWTKRRQVAVLSGFLVNVCFGVLRFMN